jgi:hypothetical protein
MANASKGVIARSPHPRANRLGVLILLGFASVVASCGTTPGSVSRSTPLAAAQSWFQAINTKNLQAAQDAFVPSQRSMMNWGGGNTATWSSFTKLHCKTLKNSPRDAIVYCSFSESASSSEGNPDSFWTISMERNGSGPWLINNYGQG